MCPSNIQHQIIIFLLDKTEPPLGSEELEANIILRTTVASNTQITHCGLQKVKILNLDRGGGRQSDKQPGRGRDVSRVY